MDRSTEVRTPPGSSYLIIATAYVVPPPRSNDRPYFEIIVAPDRARYAPRVVLRTENPTLYAQALDAEGTEKRFAIGSLPRRRSATRLELELLALDEVPTS